MGEGWDAHCTLTELGSQASQPRLGPGTAQLAAVYQPSNICSTKSPNSLPVHSRIVRANISSHHTLAIPRTQLREARYPADPVSVRDTRVSSSPPGGLCLAGRSAFPQQRKIRAGDRKLNTAKDTRAPNSSDAVVNSLLATRSPSNLASLLCPLPGTAIHKVSLALPHSYCDIVLRVASHLPRAYW